MSAVQSLSDDERAQRIRRHIRGAERRLVNRHAWLGRHDVVGFLLFLGGVAGMLTLGWLYWNRVIPAYVCILGNAFFASILHELEHDLIHFLYFRNRPSVHNLMMFFVWAFRGNIPHGWYRRTIHFHHHRASGQTSDIEERLLGLGTPWGPRRLLMTVDGFLGFLFNGGRLAREIPEFKRRTLVLSSLPFYLLFVGVFVSFLVFHLLQSLSGLGVIDYAPSALFLSVYPAIQLLAVAWVLPNYLRQASLSLISSNVHYYEDVENIHQETQVLRPMFLWPLQLFCFNFGTTHLFHHYVVEQPFYLRQLIVPQVLPVLRRYGIRFNDTGTFLRANRFRTAG